MRSTSEEDIINFLFQYSAPWFNQNENPVLYGVFTGFASIAYFIYGLLVYVKAQTRIQTSTDIFLDFTAEDFFGDILTRCPNQGDSSFRALILKLLLAPRVTRQNMINRITDITGRTPIVYEEFYDSGFYDVSFYDEDMYYGSGGNAPYQAWITAYRPLPPTSNNSIFLDQTYFYDEVSYYGAGNITNPCITDEEILNTIEITKAAGTLMHVTLSD